MNEYSDEQRAVITTDAPYASVLACAGSGKTRTLVGRIERLRKRGVQPQQMLVLSFSNTAVGELSERLAGRAEAQTFHAFGQARVDRQYKRLGTSKQPVLLTPTEHLRLVAAAIKKRPKAAAAIRSQAGIDFGRDHQVKHLADFFSRIQGDGKVARRLAEDPNSEYPGYAAVLPQLRAIYGSYRLLKDQEHAIDYPDMLRLATDAIDNGEGKLRYRYLFIDECQDMDRGQVDLLQALVKHIPNVMTFGDPDQSVFGFAGARYWDLAALMPGVQTFHLTYSFRMTQSTADLASAIVASPGGNSIAIHAGKKGPPPLFVECDMAAEQAERVAAAVRALTGRGVPANEIAVLARTKAQLRDIEFTLLANGFETAPLYVARAAVHMQKLLDLLELVEQCAARLAAGLAFDKSRLAQRLLRTVCLTDSAIPVKALADCRRDLLKIPLSRTSEGRYIGARKLYKRLLRAAGQLNTEIRVELGRWEPLCYRFASVSQFREYVLDVQTRPAVTTSTIHGAKGKEWDRVMLINVVDGSLPFYREIARGDVEEERRLLYVAVTRARERVYLFQAPFHHAPSRQIFDGRSRLLTKEVRSRLLLKTQTLSGD